jgi:signal transduction histidine kinase
MRLFHKIALLLIAAATVPLATAGFGVVARNERALESEVRERFDQTARHAAAVVANDVEGRARQLTQTAAMVPWADLSVEEATGALALLRRQTRAATAGLFDSAGKTRAVDRSAEIGDDQLAAHAPLERALREGAQAVVFSPPYDGGPLGVAIAGALAVRGGVLALALPLGGLARRLQEVRGDQPVAMLLIDAAGKPIARAGGADGVRDARRLPDEDAVAEAIAGGDGHARRFAHGQLVAAFAPVGGLGWSVLVEEEAPAAFAVARALRVRTLVGTGAAALLALIAAFLFARRLTVALERLGAAARALGEGQLGTRVTLVGDEARDEIAALGRTFNQMGEELAQGRAEIEGWNRELEARVHKRTQELKDAQAQLVQAQKLAALGQLGAGVAHEINNPLGAVIGHVQILLGEKTAASSDYESLRCIEQGAKRAAQVVQNLLRFSVQRKEPVRTTVDLNKLVRDTLSLTESLLEEHKIVLELDLPEAAPRARADSGQLAQVLLNLVANARAAMPDGGKLRIATRAEGSQVALIVEDTGKGIAPEIRHRIFEPFFTTKDEWSNVGLGLSVSYRIVEEHGGRIDVHSEVGRGSTFTVWLPAS